MIPDIDYIPIPSDNDLKHLAQVEMMKIYNEAVINRFSFPLYINKEGTNDLILNPELVGLAGTPQREKYDEVRAYCKELFGKDYEPATKGVKTIKNPWNLQNLAMPLKA